MLNAERIGRGGLVALGTGLMMVSGLLLGGCPVHTVSDDFESISNLGFDADDNAQDFNDYPWAMKHFTPDGAENGYLYVATGNSVVNLILNRIGVDLSIDPVYRAPEIRRYRPDLGAKEWERVLDYRDIENGPDWHTSGFRILETYRPADSDVTYLYAGTLGIHPALWRSTTGDPGTWERVWEGDREGSIRDLEVHDGLLYVAMTHEFEVPPKPGEIYAHDGEKVWLINDDGFGNEQNTAVFSLASFNGWLYAGTLNYLEGYEVWKLAGPDGQSEPRLVITGGGPSSANMGVSQMYIYDGYLYIPAVIFGGTDITRGIARRGADMVRLDANDQVEVIVGPGSLAGIGSGFNTVKNGYLWSLVEHDGRLFCGTWDSNSVLPIMGAYLSDILRSDKLNLFKPVPDLYDVMTGKGAELYVSEDGVHWSTVFTDGLGNPDHYGIRTMTSANGHLYLGFANVIDGLEVWESRQTEITANGTP